MPIAPAMTVMRTCIRWLFCLAVLSAWASSARAEGADLVLERAWLEDPTGQLTWEQVRERPMAPLAGIFSGGFSAAPVWIRVRIDPAAAKAAGASQLYLRIRPMYLDEIVLFDPLQQPAQQAPVGDRYRVSAQAEPATTFLFALAVGDAPRDIWLRVQTTSSRLIYADVFTPAELRLSDARINHLGSLYLGLISVFFLWGLVQILVKPEPLVYAILLNMGSWILLGACLLGYSYLYLSDGLRPGVVDLATSLLIILTTFACVYFLHNVVEELGPVRWRRNITYGVLTAFPLLMITAWAGQVSLALKINMVLVFATPILMWLMALASPPGGQGDQFASRHRGLSKPVVMGYLTLTNVFALLTALPALGLVQGVELSIYTVFFYSLSSAILMVLMLQYRAWQNMRLESEWRAIAQEAKARAQQEQAHREEREHLLAMLGHELKTPLATMRMLLADREMPAEMSDRFNLSVTEMVHVVDRVMQSGQMEAGQIRLHLEKAHLPDLVRNVCRELPWGERIEVELPDGPGPWIETDLQLLTLMLRNLLDNALKYSPNGTTVHLAVRPAQEDRLWLLQVCSAVGRAGAPDPQRVFEKYYRNPKASHRTGSGLGLYLVQGLAKALGGGIRYELVGDTVCFKVKLPAQEKETSP